jgi:hypothetical protein
VAARVGQTRAELLGETMEVYACFELPMVDAVLAKQVALWTAIPGLSRPALGPQRHLRERQSGFLRHNGTVREIGRASLESLG